MEHKFLLVGILVHLVIFYSIFDVYFKSPILKGIEPIEDLKRSSPAPAKRLVLFVADGLRADSFLNLIDSNRIEYFSGKAKSKTEAVYAISASSVPTESRPGHVAMIAGFYEDISAVAKGWKENPVEFDSFFNRSKFTWSWGSPDILTMFAKSSPQNVFIRTYDSSIEDFASENATILDQWVLHHFKKFLYHSKANKTETEMLNQDKVVFFFHLLGIDTHGHSKKPHSQAYQQNIIYVDKLVEEVTGIINDYYSNDNQTAFIFTSDHGMTDWGSHGSGDDSETLTPFVAWGAGIQTRLYDRKNLYNFKQIDISPLMSYLIGVPIAVNSMGKIPLALLNQNDQLKCMAYKMNALQLIEQLKMKYNQVRESTLFFKEYKKLTMNDLNEHLFQIDELISSHKYEQAIRKLNLLMDSSLLALDYYHKYNKLFLGVCIFLSYIGWIIYLVNHNMDRRLNTGSYMENDPATHLINIGFAILFILTIVLSLYQKFPMTYYFYTLLPQFLFRNACLKKAFWTYLLAVWSQDKLKNSLNTLFILLGIELLVLTFFYRWIFSVLLVFYSIYLTFNFHVKPKNEYIKWLIIGSSLLLAVFPLLPVIQGYAHLYLVYFSSVVSNICFYHIVTKYDFMKSSKRVTFVLSILNFLSLINIVWVRLSIDYGLGLARYCQLFSCLIVLSCIFIPISAQSVLKQRLVFVIFSLLNLYYHLSISYESLFLIVLCFQMFSWVLIESFKYSGEFDLDLALKKKRLNSFVNNAGSINNFVNEEEEEELESMNWSNAFRVYLLIFYLFLSFFGTGNMASINSFDPVSVYCFVTVFNPFVMGFLLFVKIMVPFMVVIAIFYCIYQIIDLSIQKSLVFLLIMSDLMALHFFFLIRTEGSWLDIGTSISHYIIVMCKIILVSVLFSLTHYLFKFELAQKLRTNTLLKFD